jgi:hypothetical protein
MARVLLTTCILLLGPPGCGPHVASVGHADLVTPEPAPKAEDPSAICTYWLETWVNGSPGVQGAKEARLVHLGQEGPISDATEIDFPRDPSTNVTNVERIHITGSQADGVIHCEGGMKLTNYPEWAGLHHAPYVYKERMWVAFYIVHMDMVWESDTWRTLELSMILEGEIDSAAAGLFTRFACTMYEWDCEAILKAKSNVPVSTEDCACATVVRDERSLENGNAEVVSVLEVLTYDKATHLVGWSKVGSQSQVYPKSEDATNADLIEFRASEPIAPGLVSLVTSELEPVDGSPGVSVPVEKIRVIHHIDVHFKTVFELVTARGEPGEYRDPVDLGGNPPWKADLTFVPVPDAPPEIRTKVVSSPDPDEVGLEQRFNFCGAEYTIVEAPDG